ncbi:MAG: hypothetical protein ABSH24_37235 [Bryobacteraceae bacterium]|jgi:hypothetical protein
MAANVRQKRRSARLKIIAVLFISSIIIGYTAGVAMSKKYETPTEIAAYVLSHLDDDYDGKDAVYEGRWSVESLAGTPLITSLKPTAGYIQFSCHCKSFGYQIESDTMVTPWNNESGGCLVELTEVQRRGLNFKDTLGVLVGSLEGYTLKLAITDSRNYWLNWGIHFTQVTPTACGRLSAASA